MSDTTNDRNMDYLRDDAGNHMVLGTAQTTVNGSELDVLTLLGINANLARIATALEELLCEVQLKRKKCLVKKKTK